MNVAVAGMLGGIPGHGGASWAVLQYVLGLERLGHDVWFVEEVSTPTRDSRRYFGEVTARFGLEGRAALLAGGPAPTEVRAALARADVLVNLSGNLRRPDLLELPARRVYVDLDPVFTQVWHAQGTDVGLAGHDAYFTLGDRVPEDPRISWTPMLPPVLVSEWTPSPIRAGAPFTTVGNWRSYGPVEHHGRTLGQRVHSMRSLLSIPARTDAPIELALAIAAEETADRAALDAAGWTVVDPAVVASDPDAYRAFIVESSGELSIAKSGYVLSDSGWFSERSACYLACGRPVVAQDTGFGRRLPTGEGLHSYSSAEEAAAALDVVRADDGRHAQRARAIAEEHLDSDRILPALLDG